MGSLELFLKSEYKIIPFFFHKNDVDIKWHNKKKDRLEIDYVYFLTSFPSDSFPMIKNLSAMQETWVWSLDQEDPLDKGLVTHSSLPWEYRQRRLVDYSPWGLKESEMTEQLILSMFFTWQKNKVKSPSGVSLRKKPWNSNPLYPAAKSLQSCPTLCDPIDGSPPGSPVPEILQARTLEWAAISFSSAWKWKVKVKSLSCVRLLATPRTVAYQAPLSMDFPGKSTGVGCHCLLRSLP